MASPMQEVPNSIETSLVVVACPVTCRMRDILVVLFVVWLFAVLLFGSAVTFVIA